MSLRVKLTTTLPHTFSCSYCGLCCEGPVELTERDYTRLMRLAEKLNVKLNVEPRGSGRRYLMRPVPRDELLQECVFLRREGNRRLCSIYEHRPCFCQLYPIFVGYDWHLRELYADIIHCPGVEHSTSDTGTIISEDTVKRTVLEILNYDNSFLEIVPNLSRAVPFSLYPQFRELLVAWSIKFQLVTALNRELETRLDTCENLLHLIYVLASFQQIVNESIRESTNVFEIPSTVSRKRARHIGLDQAFKVLVESLAKAGLTTHKKTEVVLLDNYNKTVYGVDLSLSELREFEIDSTTMLFVKECLYRLSCLFQTVALPLEIMYVRGLMLLLALCILYSNLCDEAREFMYNFDAVGLSVYTRYVVNMLKDLGLELIVLDYSHVKFA